jgi:hypothetical protein
MNKPTSQNIPLSDASQEARKVQHPALLLNANQERGDTTAKGARVAGLEGYTTSGLIEELERRKISLRGLEITKSELEKQFMQEREHWLALRDDNTRLIRIVDDLLKERGKVGNEKDRD